MGVGYGYQDMYIRIYLSGYVYCIKRSILTAPTLNSGILAKGSKAVELVNILAGFSPKWMGKNNIPGFTSVVSLAGTSICPLLEVNLTNSFGCIFSFCASVG